MLGLVKVPRCVGWGVSPNRKKHARCEIGGMFHWICPECGREIPPAVKECPACDPKAQVQPIPAALAPVVAETPVEPVPLPLAALQIRLDPAEAAPTLELPIVVPRDPLTAELAASMPAAEVTEETAMPEPVREAAAP